MKIYIKYMVSIRCKMAVMAVLDELEIQHGVVDPGEVEITSSISSEDREQLRARLMKWGLELMDDRKAIIIQRIKNTIVEMVHYSDELPKVKNSTYIAEKLDQDYTYLANLFSETTGTTIEQFVIMHKIERVKELLLYDELNLTEISYLLNYSSVAHLSMQFKKLTGLTPTYFRTLKHKKREVLEKI